MWFPSTSPLVAFKTEFTYTTQTLLCYCVRSDVVNFFKHIWKKQLLPTPQFNSNNTFNTQFPTKSFKQKLSLKTNDTMMIHLVRKLLLSLFSDEAMARLPQPIVELAATLKTRNREASEILLLNLFLLPSLSILLVNKNDASYMGFNFNQFFEVTDSIFEWWDLFTSAVSPDQSQVVPKMSAAQFLECYDCPSWCAVVWLTWCVLQRSFDINRDVVMQHTATNSHLSPVVDDLATELAPMVNLWLDNVAKLSHHTILVGQPFLPPKMFSLRLELHRTAKCREMVNLAVLSLGELIFMFDKLQGEGRGEREGIIEEFAAFLGKNGLVGGMDNAISLYGGHFCLLKLEGGGGGGGGEGGEGSDIDHFENAVPPPPPPLPPGENSTNGGSGGSPEAVANQTKLEVELQRGMNVLFKFKNELESMKNKTLLTAEMFRREGEGKGGRGRRGRGGSGEREGNINVGRGSSTPSGGNRINGKVYEDLGEKQIVQYDYQSIVVCATNHQRTIVRKSTTAADEPLTHYERNLLFMGELRGGDNTKRGGANSRRVARGGQSGSDTSQLDSMLRYNSNHNINVSSSNYGQSGGYLSPKKGRRRGKGGGGGMEGEGGEGGGAATTKAPLPFPKERFGGNERNATTAKNGGSGSGSGSGQNTTTTPRTKKVNIDQLRASLKNVANAGGGKEENEIDNQPPIADFAEQLKALLILEGV
ncbi:hypothetical protein ScalyP_jg3777 [Parmales sp. scaly parma]|nr:hypothetical protein ScalyP_jg3777 [Parmales sp. scaly parma]